jgi:hypothetical protein
MLKKEISSYIDDGKEKTNHNLNVAMDTVRNNSQLETETAIRDSYAL